jgi:hypothetical protein
MRAEVVRWLHRAEQTAPQAIRNSPAARLSATSHTSTPRVVPIWRQANSTGLREMLAEVHADLAARYPGDGWVKELADALA